MLVQGRDRQDRLVLLGGDLAEPLLVVLVGAVVAVTVGLLTVHQKGRVLELAPIGLATLRRGEQVPQRAFGQPVAVGAGPL